MIKEEFINKMIKHYWVDCIDKDTGDILLDQIDGSAYFGGVLTNEKGYVEIELIEFINLVGKIVKSTEQYLEKN